MDGSSINLHERIDNMHKKSFLEWFYPKKKTFREYIRSFNKVMMAFMAFSMAFSIMLTPANIMVAHAANENVAGGEDPDNKDDPSPSPTNSNNSAERAVRDAWTFEEVIKQTGFTFPDKYSQFGTDNFNTSLHNQMKENFKSSSEYARWLKLALTNVEYSGSKDGGYTFEAVPKGLDGEATANLTDSQLSKAYTGYNSVANKFNKIMARSAIDAVTKDVFKTDEFDPTNAFVYGAIQYFTNAMNTLFNISSRVLMIGFLGQTGADCLFLVLPATGAILAAANAQSHGAGAGGIGGGAKGSESGLGKIIKFNIVSDEAIEAANGSAASTGRVGGVGGNSQGGGIMSNKAVKYLILRSPLIVIACTYLVLVATNLWEKLIAYISTVTTQALYSFL